MLFALRDYRKIEIICVWNEQLGIQKLNNNGNLVDNSTKNTKSKTITTCVHGERYFSCNSFHFLFSIKFIYKKKSD